MNQQPQQQIQIKANDEDLKGRYSNLIQIVHSKEEFLFDFLNVFPPTGVLCSRIMLSPGHFKRMLKAMDDNLKRYEDQFGKIEEAEALNQSIGFQG
jgi:hypothetical protein